MLSYEPAAKPGRAQFELEADDGRGGLTVLRAVVEIAPAPVPVVEAPSVDAATVERPSGEEAQPEPAPTEKASPTPDDVMAAQRQLQALGYLVGGADGKLGPKTRAAIRTFQEGAGLAADGEVSPMLLAALADPSAPTAPRPEPGPKQKEAAEGEAELAPQPTVALTTPTVEKPDDANDGAADALLWQSIQASEDPADFEDYLARFPNGAFVPRAKQRLAALSAPAPAAAPVETAALPQPALSPTPAKPEDDLCLTLKQWSVKTFGTAYGVAETHNQYKSYLRNSGCKVRGQPSTAAAAGKSMACPSMREWLDANPDIMDGAGAKCPSSGSSEPAIQRCMYNRFVQSSKCEPSSSPFN
jgi:peptidoglycan hydrolase-like protein with peptidoglycan-binding domain